MNDALTGAGSSTRLRPPATTSATASRLLPRARLSEAPAKAWPVGAVCGGDDDRGAAGFVYSGSGTIVASVNVDG